MKKIALLLFLCMSLVGFSQNLVTNGDFETGSGSPIPAPWLGYSNQLVVDDLTGSNVGNGNANASSFYQVLEVSPNTTYDVIFDYRWKDNAVTTSNAMTVRVKDGVSDTVGPNIATLTLQTTFALDTWLTNQTFSFTTGPSTYKATIIFFKGSGTDPIRIDNVSVTVSPDVTWNGSFDSNWGNAINWDTAVPISSDIVLIPNGLTNYPTAASAITVDEIFIDSGASFIGQGAVNATLTYYRSVPDNKWHLISNPLLAQVQNDNWISANGIASGTGNNRGISYYDNGTPDPSTAHWRYFQAGSIANFSDHDGWSLLKLDKGLYTFRGFYETNNVNTTITQGASNNWNLIGNPYPSYMDIASFLTTNTAALEDVFEAVYVWDASANLYTGLTTGFIHPGQAFFVSSAVASTSVSITEAMQSHQTGITFYRNSENDATIDLMLSNGATTKTTQVNYLEGKTRGLDPGFDLGLFSGVSSDLNIYTHLVEDTYDIGFERQALPNNDFENLIIPVGIKATSGTEITISVPTANLPSGIEVYLEDKDDNSFTLLNNSSNFTTTLASGLNGIGRFFLHTSSNVLSIDDLKIDNISIYTSSNNNLRIVGVQNGNTQVKIHNILGKQVLSTSFQGNGVNNITIPKVQSGVYIVQLETETVTLNKKVIIE
jgi:hypothetical protein